MRKPKWFQVFSRNPAYWFGNIKNYLEHRKIASEFKGTGFIGGDTQSAWACHTYSVRYMKANKLGPYRDKK